MTPGFSLSSTVWVAIVAARLVVLAAVVMYFR
jgi:hypothetical protein